MTSRLQNWTVTFDSHSWQNCGQEGKNHETSRCNAPQEPFWKNLPPLLFKLTMCSNWKIRCTLTICLKNHPPHPPPLILTDSSAGSDACTVCVLPVAGRTKLNDASERPSESISWRSKNTPQPHRPAMEHLLPPLMPGQHPSRFLQLRGAMPQQLSDDRNVDESYVYSGPAWVEHVRYRIYLYEVLDTFDNWWHD